MIKSDRNVLVIAYLFPPIGGIAVQRPLKFVQYLEDYGWSPTVLTTRQVYSATMDESLSSQIPAHVKVIRVDDPLSRWMGQVIRQSVESSRGTRVRQQTVAVTVKGWLRRLLKWMKNSLLIPDESIIWALRAAWTGIVTVQKQHINVIYTTSGPHSTHLTGWLISKFTPVKWVADFRDPWTDNIHFTHYGIRRSLEQWLERRVMRRADAVVTVTASFQALFAHRYPEVSHRISVIRNGVDPNDFPPPQPVDQNRPFTFFYAGILYPMRSPAPFLQALSAVIRYGRIKARDVRVEFAGVFDYPGQSANRDLVEQLGLEANVDIIGYLSHQEVLSRMQSVDSLLLIGDQGESAKQYVPGKLYEYLFAGVPILALMEDGEGASIIREADAGCVIQPARIPDICDEIVRLVQAKRTGSSGFAPNTNVVASYNRRSQAGELAQVLTSLCQPFDYAPPESVVQTSSRLT